MTFPGRCKLRGTPGGRLGYIDSSLLRAGSTISENSVTRAGLWNEAFFCLVGSGAGEPQNGLVSVSACNLRES